MRTTPTLHHLLALMLACSTSNATTAQSIGAGANCSAFICNDGELRTWGNNSYGQLGDSTIQAHSTGTPVYGSLSVREVAGGLGHTVALATDSTVWCWGRNDFGALGNGTTDWSTIPVQVTGLDNVVAIAAGDMFSVALRADGTAWAWGQNNYGQLGIGSTGSGSLVPVQVGITDLVAIAAGFGNLLAIASDGTVWGYGLNDRGQLGAGPGAPTICSTPVQALGIDSVVALSSSRYAHTVALCADGSVWTWGYNLFGQLGDGTTTERNTPAPVPGLSNMSAIAQQNGFGHTLAVRNDGTLWAWGYNLKGQLGLGSNNNNILVPTQVTSIADVVAVSCGESHTIALKSDGTAWAWGNNNSGQLGDGTILDKSTPVAVNGICIDDTGVPGHRGNTHALHAYPNPNDGHFALRWTSLPPHASATVHNALGAVVMELSPAQLVGADPIDLSQRPNGTYHIRVSTPSRAIAAPVMIAR